jgi:ferritin-like metal-binding protein YciE
MQLDTLEKLMVHELKDLYSAETQLVDALPKMRDAASADPLKKAFEDHLKETKGQVERLEKIFAGRSESPSGETCNAMQGLIREAEDTMKEKGDPRVMDAALICMAQKVEHYEIGSYGTVRAYARILGEDECQKLVEETLEEERHADKLLTEIAEDSINKLAKAASAQKQTA